MPEGGTQHERSEPEAFGPGRESSQRRERLERSVQAVAGPVPVERREEVIRDPHGVEPEALGADRLLGDRLERDRRDLRQREVVVRQGEADAHGAQRYRRTSAGPVTSVPGGIWIPEGSFSLGYTEISSARCTPG